MASKITLFEPHFDGPVFGGDCDCDGHGHSATDRDSAGADPDRDGPDPETESCPGRSIGLIALGLLSLAVLAVAVVRWRGGESAAVDLTAGE
ncbi:hypothetical protein [Halococcoides cellulosivorans]|uniref:Uncharacterized protein n=1 Tax=Halococcoides cellulosivorans TaxID=1679096 RepID=A0A2R4X2M6_9EURY|nr:hypothetical protein [Halococcoides cellulosivorans]AWB28024.1 hypothetical protein HARCEL1_10035 [Halococcoides cellulosivorans]